MRKKAQGISMNVIIIAAIALIVMIVLIAIFTGRITVFQEKAKTGQEQAEASICAEQGGSCSEECPEGFTELTPPGVAWTDCPTKCCLREE